MPSFDERDLREQLQNAIAQKRQIHICLKAKRKDMPHDAQNCLNACHLSHLALPGFLA